MGVVIEVSDRQRTGLSAELIRQLSAAARLLRSPVRELSVALVNDAEMADLHWRFMRVRGPTDVLTFELDHDARHRVTSGEIIICVPYARRQVRRSKSALREELLLYAVHGLLHLCGYDDRTQSAFLRMHQTEDMILTKLGVGPVFARGSVSAARSVPPGNRAKVRKRATNARRSKGNPR